MRKFIENPNLPDGKVSLIISGGMHKEVESFLLSREIKILFVEENPFVDRSISSHVDITVLHLGRGDLLIDNKQTILAYELQKLKAGIIFSNKSIEGEYPNDVALNFAVMGKYVIGNFKYADSALQRFLQDKICINVNQGYAKCSCLIVNENSLITDDVSIYQETCKYGLDCLLVRKGDVALEGHDYGFIGGTGGKISNTEILFFGDIKKHRDFDAIKTFIEGHGCKIISFDGIPLTDFGGIVPFIDEYI